MDNGIWFVVGALALWGILVFGVKTKVETTVSGSFSEASFLISEIYRTVDEIHALTARHYAAGKMKVVDGPESATTAIQIAMKWVQISDLVVQFDEEELIPAPVPEDHGEILKRVEFWANKAGVTLDFSNCEDQGHGTIAEMFRHAESILEEEYRTLHERHGKF